MINMLNKCGIWLNYGKGSAAKRCGVFLQSGGTNTANRVEITRLYAEPVPSVEVEAVEYSAQVKFHQDIDRDQGQQGWGQNRFKPGSAIGYDSFQTGIGSFDTKIQPGQ